MNSRQRRTQRVFEHEVTLVYHEGERYLEFDRKVDQAKGWLQWRVKRKNYVLGPKLYDRQTFKFRNGGLAAMFALKWL
jgi:hypothetical protein